MIKKSPEQALYDTVYAVIEQDLHYTIFTHNPPISETPYPFVQMGNIQLITMPTKSYLMGTLSMVLTVWGDASNRLAISDMTHEILTAVSKIRQAGGYHAYAELSECGYMLSADNSTNHDLWRSDISLQFIVQ